ncbi:YicC/YloC family endoribonuclease [Hasllibacter sp. MH4015]|uniref:YicC/YloC family endoribonuclease n=1 Tax=Hasllibacter sp. MH4015 TaxID=2854029 RepID=UPI001CD663D7|nr:YicC/YloC family endoribonuclease [Hasllibacter sp. MH4015]
MTAFAAAEGDDGASAWTWDMRGVNGRGLDLRLRLPDGFGALEVPLRAALGKALARGNVTVNLKVTRTKGAGGGMLDPDALGAVLHAMAEVEARAADAGLHLAPSDASGILAQRGVWDIREVAAAPDLAALMAEAEHLIAAFVAMRRAEGAALAEVMEAQLTRIADLTEAAAESATARAAAQGERLKTQVSALLETTDIVDEGRLAQELAVLAVKADVTEEIDRLRAHVTAARDLIAGGGPVGRKLDFLMQEFNREANTLCSKSGDAGLTAIGLDLKLTIDQMREQVQNVE